MGCRSTPSLRLRILSIERSSNSSALPSLWRATPIVTFEPSWVVIGSCHSTGSCLLDADPEPRPLPSTGITRPLRYYGPLRHPMRPGLPLTRFRLKITLLHRKGFPCSDDSRVHACQRHYPGGTLRVLSLVTLGGRRPSPLPGWVGFRIACFEACSAFTRVPACMLAKSQKDPLHRRLRRIRYLLRRSDCYRLERPVAGWESHPLRIADLHGVPGSLCYRSPWSPRISSWKLELPVSPVSIRAKMSDAACLAVDSGSFTGPMHDGQPFGHEHELIRDSA